MFNEPNYGLLPNPIDERDAWLDMVMGGEDIDLPEEYKTEGLEFEPQGAYPFCTAMAVTKLAEISSKKIIQFSKPHLFFNGGGGKKGLILELF